MEGKVRERIYLLLIIGAFIIVSCSLKSEQDVEKLPGIDIPINEMNLKIALEPDPGMPQVHKNGETLGFLIRNRSSSTISFDQDFGIVIFKKQEGAWEPVENKWGYPEGENILPPAEEDPTGLGLFVFPDVGIIEQVINIRIVVVGHQKDRPTEQVAAYYDVQYEP
jgi:hypothetical protein